MTGVKSIPGLKFKISTGYIAIPADLDRETYIKDCFTNLQVSILTEDGGFMNRVPISQELLNWVYFPADKKKMGTPILYGTDDIYQQPVVITVLQAKELLGDGRENQFKLKRVLDDVTVELSGSAADRSLNLVVNGGENDSQLNINVFSDNKDSVLNVDIAGEIKITSSKGVSFEQHGTLVSTTSDESDDSEDEATFTQTSTEHQFENKKLVINKGDDPLVLGNELKDLLSDFFDEVGSITTATAIGTQPILNKIQILKFKERLDKILSQVIFIDK